MATLLEFEPQSQETSLSREAVILLRELTKQHQSDLTKLNEHLAKAVEYLSSTVAQVNDRAREERTDHRKKLNRLAKENENEPEDEREGYEDFQHKVDALTKKMDISVRRLVDDRIWMSSVPDALSHVVSKSASAADTTIQQGTPSTQTTNRTTQRSILDDSDDESALLNDEPNMTESQALAPPNPAKTPTSLLQAAFSTHDTKWRHKTLTEKYADDNDYKGFYRMVYDAKNGDSDTVPPMPHHSMWFAVEEGRTTNQTTSTTNGLNPSQRQRNTQSQNEETNEDEEGESDIEIASERLRITCPITLAPFREPLASTKCPHAYEKSAILSMLQTTTDHVPLTTDQLIELSQIPQSGAGRAQRQKREKEMKTPQIKCPECSVPITQADLRPDPVLLRKVNRILEAQRRKEEMEMNGGASGNVTLDLDGDGDEDDDEDELGLGGRRRMQRRKKIVTLGSSPPGSMRKRASGVVKTERGRTASAIPQTQFSRGGDGEDEDMYN